MFALAGFFGVLSGLALVGLTTSADANIALRYTLLSIAGVILGGGEFVGGRVSPIGAVIGAMTLTLAGSFLSFLRLNPDWQIGAQGAILILVLALRVLINRAGGPGVTALRRARRPALALVLARRARGLARRSSPSPAARAAPSVLTAALTFATFSVLVAPRPDVRRHPRPRQCRPVDPGHHDAGRHRRDEGDGRGRTR